VVGSGDDPTGADHTAHVAFELGEDHVGGIGGPAAGAGR
jgi:hypothetical protein